MTVDASSVSSLAAADDNPDAGIKLFDVSIDNVYINPTDVINKIYYRFRLFVDSVH